MKQMKDRIFVATFSENAVSVIRSYGVGIELNDLCISENLDSERLQTTTDMMQQEIRRLTSMAEDELYQAAKDLQVDYNLVKYVAENGKLPVVNFAAGGVATPADAALMMQLGAEGVFVGSGIFKSGNPAKRAAAIVKAVTNFTDAKMIAELSEDLGEAMVGINEQEIQLLMAERGK